MNEMKFLLFAVLVSAVMGILWYGYFRRKEKALLRRLQVMIDSAVNGKLERSEISEAQLSAIENSLKRYLDDSQLGNQGHQQQKDMMESLISDIAHQTLTPISNIKIYTELLAEQNEEGQVEIQTIQEQTDKLDFLIHSLVKLSRLESGIVVADIRETELSRLLDAADREYRGRAEAKQITFEVPGSELKAKFDVKWTGEALGNIIDNAIKYTMPGGTVKITVEKYSFFIKLSVADSGIGIGAEELNKVFSRFFRSQSVSEQPGVGIGLFLAREIIQKQKGYIKVSSEMGQGSVFSIFLPR